MARLHRGLKKNNNRIFERFINAEEVDLSKNQWETKSTSSWGTLLSCKSPKLILQFQGTSNRIMSLIFQHLVSNSKWAVQQ